MPIIELQANIPLVFRIFDNSILKKLLAPTARDKIGIGRIMGIAKDVARERFGPNAKVQNDMLGSFVRHGLTPAETESEALLQM